MVRYKIRRWEAIAEDRGHKSEDKKQGIKSSKWQRSAISKHRAVARI